MIRWIFDRLDHDFAQPVEPALPLKAGFFQAKPRRSPNHCDPTLQSEAPVPPLRAIRLDTSLASSDGLECRCAHGGLP